MRVDQNLFFGEVQHHDYFVTIDELIVQADKFDFWNQSPENRKEFARQIFDEYSEVMDDGDELLTLVTSVGYPSDRRLDYFNSVSELLDAMDTRDELTSYVSGHIEWDLARTRQHIDRYHAGNLEYERYYEEKQSLYERYMGKKSWH